MLHALITFLPVAALLTITPGAATAMVVRSAARGGRRQAFFTTTGNTIGVLAWGCFAAVGIATVVATSTAAFTTVKLVGAVLLIAMGARSLLAGRHADGLTPDPRARSKVSDLGALRAGLLTSVANPKLAVFYVALFPQFVPRGAPVLSAALGMTALIVVSDLIWYSTLALIVSRARSAFLSGPWQRRVERLTGAVLIGLGVRLALERR